jgi:hypothetical protein
MTRGLLSQKRETRSASLSQERMASRRDKTNGGAASKLVDGKFQDKIDNDRGSVEDL